MIYYKNLEMLIIQISRMIKECHTFTGHVKVIILEAIGRINEKNNDILELMLQHGLNLDKMEGDMTLKEKIESFHDDEMNKIIVKYYSK